MKTRKFIIFSILLLLSDCSAQISNDVYLNLEKEYPESSYLYAIGEGDTRKDAEKNAIAKLSLIFETNINVNNTFSEHFIEFSDDDNSSLTYKSKTTSKINLHSNQKLLNVKYGKYKVDEIGKNYAVAYIDRDETSSIYDKLIENNNSGIIKLYNSANNSDTKINNYAALNKASKLINENIYLMKQLSFISQYNPEFSDKLSYYDNVYRKKGEVASSISFVISDDIEINVRNTLTSLLTSKGFKISELGDFLLNATINFEEVDLNRTEIFYHWFLNVELFNTKHDMIFNYEKKGREGGISESAAYSRAKHTANDKLKNQFILSFENYLNSLLGE